MIALLVLRLYSHLLAVGRVFGPLILYAVGRTYWTGDEPVARPVQTVMPRVAFEPRTPASQQGKTVRGKQQPVLTDWTAHVVMVNGGLKHVLKDDPGLTHVVKDDQVLNMCSGMIRS
jgi:hypothetical protein